MYKLRDIRLFPSTCSWSLEYQFSALVEESARARCQQDEMRALGARFDLGGVPKVLDRLVLYPRNGNGHGFASKKLHPSQLAAVESAKAHHSVSR